jgi:hypothetical protein
VEPLYGQDGATVIPSVYTRGPWDPGLEHGGAVGALLAEVLQGSVDPELQPARMTVDLLRPVPLHPLEVTTQTLRQGKRLSVTEAVLTWNAVPVARGSLVAIRPKELGLPADVNPPLEPPVGDPESVEAVWGLTRESESFVGGALEARFSDAGVGQGTGWLRLFRDVLPDRPPSPLARAMGAADTTGAVARVTGERLPISFVNADLSVSLHRLPQGEWVHIAAQATWGGNGIGHAVGELSDGTGSFGTSNLALVLDHGAHP